MLLVDQVTLKVELAIICLARCADQLHHAGGAVGRHQGMVGALRCRESFPSNAEAVLERELLLYHRPGHGRCHGHRKDIDSKPSSIAGPLYRSGGLIEIQRFFPDTLYW